MLWVSYRRARGAELATKLQLGHLTKLDALLQLLVVAVALGVSVNEVTVEKLSLCQPSRLQVNAS